jgi:hypothetical protein
MYFQVTVLQHFFPSLLKIYSVVALNKICIMNPKVAPFARYVRPAHFASLRSTNGSGTVGNSVSLF